MEPQQDSFDSPSTLSDGDVFGFELLPDEIVELIMLRLPLPAVVAVGACCSRLRRIASSDTIWRWLYEAFPRGRTSSGGLPWCDVYKRAVRSMPKSDAFELQPADIAYDSKHKFLAFDAARRRLLSASSDVLYSAEFDGTPVASVALVDRRAKVFVNRASGTYVVVGGYPSLEVQVLDSNLQATGSCTIDLNKLNVELSSFAIDSGGRLFVFGFDFGIGFSISVVDVASGQVTTGLEPTQIIQEHPAGVLIDSHDCIVAWHDSGRISTHTAQGRLVSVFDCGVCPTNVMVSADGIFAIAAARPFVGEWAVLFLAGDGRLLRADRSCDRGKLRFLGWTDEHLLLEGFALYRGRFCFLR
eukprot:TRINITY_DN5394_c0_g1_i1.p1 TRINITY_DN5394_c0_g1~~TRINITY_DN5394_c0_g1_i1.p1  ORF type:complete len:394 (-),score=14.37 TRINITY_DN5394_c0_g1_i1:86-1156(-)